jgi:hypothetical protein
MLLAEERLNGTQREQFREALRPAFEIESFGRMLQDHLDKKIDDIIIPRGMSFLDVLGIVIDKAEQESWTAQLLQAALSVRREDNKLNDFAQQFGIVIKTPPLKELVSKQAIALERNVNKQVPMYALELLIKRLHERGNQICYIQNASGQHLGTGFLIKPDIIMTAYHVWEAADMNPENFVCFFAHGTTAKSDSYHLATQNWKVHLSEYNAAEQQPDGKEALPTLNQLDYALLRLAKAPGNESIRYPYHQREVRRGWIELYPREYDFEAGTPLFILHYPAPEPLSCTTLKVSIETNAITDWSNENETRIRYTTNTESGSSGAPCFNVDWQLVALHHAGDPNRKKDHQPEYNQGVPLSAISKLLKEHCVEGIFSDPKSLENNTRGHEISEDTEPASHSHNQDSSSAKGQHHTMHLETGMPKPLPVIPQPQEEETPTDGNEDGPSKIIDFIERKSQRKPQKIDADQSFLKRASQQFDSAQKLVNEAYAPFAKGAHPVPIKYREAAESLKAANEAIQSLRTSLFSDSSVPEALLKNRRSINDFINTVAEQIEKHLIPPLNWRQKGNFAPLQQALQEIGKLLPEQNTV